MGKLVIVSTGEEFEVSDGSPIQPTCEEAGVPFGCSEGICGTCVITIKEGKENLSEYTDREKDFLGNEGHERLACQCRLKKGTVKIDF
jgi:ferredoxin